jgi:hypothetical protein
MTYAPQTKTRVYKPYTMADVQRMEKTAQRLREEAREHHYDSCRASNPYDAQRSERQKIIADNVALWNEEEAAYLRKSLKGKH